MFGQVAGKAYEDKRPRDRYATESERLLGVLDERLVGRDWVMGLITASPKFRCSVDRKTTFSDDR